MESHPESSYFVTLTYNDDCLPHNRVYRFESDGTPAQKVPTVSKADIQHLHMDMRRRYQQGFFHDDTLVRLGLASVPHRVELDPDAKFSYYVTSEYGPLGHRPHYHGLYFGLSEDPDETYCLFNSLWKKGFVYCEPAQSDKAAAYVAKYLINSSLVPIPEGANRPFSLISKGLGADYLESELVEWHREAPRKRNFVPVNSSRACLPRYLRDKIFDDEMKAEILDDCVRRDENEKRKIESMNPVERMDYYKERKFKEEESIRQAIWRFQKSGKIK